MTYRLKFLDPGAIGPYSGFGWPKPRGSRPGKWVRVDALVVCERGIHVCTWDQAPWWLRAEAWVIEVAGDVLDAGDKQVWSRGRLVRQAESWDRVAVVRFACDCAARVLSLFQERYPDDDRPRKAIQAARAWARCPCERHANSVDAAAAAYTAAANAAADAANAAYNAAADAANAAYAYAAAAAAYAAYAAARAAYVSYAAVGGASHLAYTPYTAAANAAYHAAYAVRAAARDAGGEHRWQARRLRHYIDAPEVAA
jgi:hypothetical protein